MKVAVYTLTWDRLEYTKHCLLALRKKAGYPYDHFIVDNGSADGTVGWLQENSFHGLIFNKQNAGLSRSSNQALDAIRGYDLIIKFDNDCEVVTDGILREIVEIYRSEGGRYVLSPRVEGVNRQPERGWYSEVGGRRIGWTSIVGGLFQAAPAEIYEQYRYPEDLPKFRGQSAHFCSWVRANGGQVGYIEDLVVNHYEGTDRQVSRYPEYFRRKEQEEIQPQVGDGDAG